MDQSKIKKFLLSFILALFTSLSLLSQQKLWVGQSYTFDVTSSVIGLTANMSWTTSGGYLTLSGSGFYRTITVTKYFSGTATVTCEWDYKLTGNSTYTHTKRQVTISCQDNQVSISPTSMTMSPGETKYVSYRHQFDNQYTSFANAYFQSTNPSIVRVDERSGEVHAVSPGTAYINVYSKVSSTSPYCLVTVNKVDPTSVSLPNNITLTAGESKTITPTLTPSNAQTSFSWTSSNSEIATVNVNGCIQAKKPGNTTITVRTSNGLSASCNVVVNKPKLTLSPSLDGGLYPNGKLLELRSNVSDATIYYTQDGSIPTKNSILYTTPLKMTTNFILKAKAIHPDYIDSDILTQEYELTDLKIEEIFPSNQGNIVSDIHLPYIAFNNELSNHIEKSYITFTIDGKKCEFSTAIVKNILQIIPKKIDEYRGNHQCTINIEQYALSDIDGNPSLSVSYAWRVSASDEYYSLLPISIYAGEYASAYISTNRILNTWGGWPTEGGWSYYKTFSFDNVKSSCISESIFAYIDNDNKLWLAGYDSYFFPYQKTPIVYESDVIDVAYASESTLFFVKKNGDLYGVGSDRFNQLMGKGNKKSASPYVTIYYADTPIKLMDGVKSVVSRDRNCAVIKNDGSLWMWGEYDFFDHLKLTSPKKIADNVKQASITSSEPVTFVKNDNTGWYVDDKTLAIKKIGENIISVEGSKERGFYITTENKLYGWGRNDHGQIGNGTITSYPYTLPENAQFIMDDICMVSCNWDYTLALTTKGEVYGWGKNSCYRLDKDKPTDYNQTYPQLLFSPLKNTTINDFSIPDEISLPLNTFYSVPIKVMPLDGVFNDIQWISSDENIASIDKNGILFGKSIGDCELKIIVYPFEATAIEKIIKIHIMPEFNAGIAEITEEGQEYPIEIYNIQGLKVLNNTSKEEFKNLPHGIYIRRQGNISEKFIIK